MNSKFNESFTREMNRFQIANESTQFRIPHNRERTGGLTPGDRVKFSEKIISSDWFKSQPENVQEIVRELHDGDLNLFVDEVHGESGEGDKINVVIARELAPGFQCQNSKVTLPANLCEFLGLAGERAGAPIPDSWRGPERVTIKPEPVKMESEEVANSPEEQTNKTDHGDCKLSDTELTLTDKNIPGQKGGTYTSNYLPSS